MKRFGIYGALLTVCLLGASCGQEHAANGPTQAEAMSSDEPLKPGATNVHDTTGAEDHPGATNTNYRADRTQNENR